MAPVIKVLQDPEATAATCNDQTCSRWKPYSNSKDFERDAWLILGILFGFLFFGIGIHAAVCCIIRRRHRPRQQAHSGGVLVISLPSTELNSTAAKQIAASGGDGVGVNGEVLLFNSGYDKNCYNKLAVNCAICLSEFEGGDRVMVLEGCKHGFHVNCIKEWLSAHSSCPICRAITAASSSSSSGIN